jgi:copper chaperone CopZ
MAVRQSLNKLPTVEIKEVSIGKAVVQYDETRVTHEDLVRAVEDAGYVMTN